MTEAATGSRDPTARKRGKSQLGKRGWDGEEKGEHECTLAPPERLPRALRSLLAILRDSCATAREYRVAETVAAGTYSSAASAPVHTLCVSFVIPRESV